MAPMQPSVIRPLLALLTLLFAVSSIAAMAQADALPTGTPQVPAQLEAQAPGVGAAVALPAAPAPPMAVGVAPVQTASDLLAGSTATLPLRAVADVPLLQAPRGAAAMGVAPASPEGGAYQSQAAAMAAAGALGALTTFAAHAEPVRRALFLLALPLYSRLRRSELLDNDVRQRIHQAVETHPGVSIIQVCRAAKVGWGTAVYHLQRLERDRMIVSRRDGQYRRFFLNGHAPVGAADPAAKALGHPLAARIAAFVAANPGAAQKDVCLALGIQPPLASKWLGRLLDAGLLTSRREWKLVRYEPTPALAAALAPPAVAAPLAAGVPA